MRCGPRRPLPAGFLLHAVRGCRTRNPLRCLSQECRICCEEYAHGSRKRILPCNHGLHPAACLRPPTISSPHPPLLHSRPIAFHPACVDLWLLGSREQGPPRGERVCPICKSRPPIPLPSPPHMTWRVPPTVLAPSHATLHVGRYCYVYLLRVGQARLRSSGIDAARIWYLEIFDLVFVFDEL